MGMVVRTPATPSPQVMPMTPPPPVGVGGGMFPPSQHHLSWLMDDYMGGKSDAPDT